MQTEPLKLYEKHWFIRAMEIVPGLITWLFILLPIVFSLFAPVVVAYFIIAFDLFWLIKAIRLSFNLIKGYATLHRFEKINWHQRLDDLGDLDKASQRSSQQLAELLEKAPYARRFWLLNRQKQNQRQNYLNLVSHSRELEELSSRPHTLLQPTKLTHVVVLAVYNESRELLESSIEALCKVDYNLKQIVLIIAYEERGGAETEANCQDLAIKYNHHFKYMVAVKHPDGRTNETRGKGANISYAAKRFLPYIKEHDIAPENVIVTTFDADNKPSKNYFSELSYTYCIDPNRIHTSYQPIPMFYNNIWDVPAPIRVIATGNSFWPIMMSMRPHLLRNFSAHAQSLQTLIDTDFWSVHTIVEDGHQYWRTFFTYNGDHHVVPIFAPIFQDAVLANGYLRTFKVQYLQLRRWSWGASDFAYAMTQSLKYKSISWSNKGVEMLRLLESHVSWSTAPLLLSFVAWLPLLINNKFKDQLLAHQLPIIASRILTLAALGIVITIFISLISLPPRPKRHKKVKFLSMVVQWSLVPVVTIFFSSFPAIDSQTRLMLGKYLDFRVTEKATAKK